MAALALSASALRIPIQMECSEEAWVIKITFILFCESTSNKRFEEPATPIIPEPSSVSKAMLSICEIPLMGLAVAFGVSEINVPYISGSKVFLIKIGMLSFKTGCMVGGYNTLAPKCDSSIAS